MIFKFRNPSNSAIYARFLQLHPRSHFKNESKYWSEQDDDLESMDVLSSDDESPSVDLPFASSQNGDSSNYFAFMYYIGWNDRTYFVNWSTE